MTAPAPWPQDRLARFWALQTRARNAGLHLTAGSNGAFRIRRRVDDVGKVVADLAGAEQVVAAVKAAHHE